MKGQIQTMQHVISAETGQGQVGVRICAKGSRTLRDRTRAGREWTEGTCVLVQVAWFMPVLLAHPSLC